jgi:tyrosyl-tRNA synthetase
LVSGLAPDEVERALALQARDAKATLARALVKRLHGEEAAQRAEDDFDRRIRRREKPEAEDIPEFTVEPKRNIVSVIHELGWASTRRKAREQIGDGRVRVNDKVVGEGYPVLDGDVIQVGTERIGKVLFRNVRHRREKPEADNIPEFTVEPKRLVQSVIRERGWAPTRRKAREQIEDGSVRVNDKVVGEGHPVLDGDVIQVGKKRIGRVRFVVE